MNDDLTMNATTDKHLIVPIPNPVLTRFVHDQLQADAEGENKLTSFTTIHQESDSDVMRMTYNRQYQVDVPALLNSLTITLTANSVNSGEFTTVSSVEYYLSPQDDTVLNARIVGMLEMTASAVHLMASSLLLADNQSALDLEAIMAVEEEPEPTIMEEDTEEPVVADATFPESDGGLSDNGNGTEISESGGESSEAVGTEHGDTLSVATTITTPEAETPAPVDLSSDWSSTGGDSLSGADFVTTTEEVDSSEVDPVNLATPAALSEDETDELAEEADEQSEASTDVVETDEAGNLDKGDGVFEESEPNTSDDTTLADALDDDDPDALDDDLEAMADDLGDDDLEDDSDTDEEDSTIEEEKPAAEPETSFSSDLPSANFSAGAVVAGKSL